MILNYFVGLLKSILFSFTFAYVTPPNPQVDHHAILLEEGGVALSLTVLDTPGFGDKLDNSSCWHPVSSYVEDQFDKFLEAETRVDRVKLVDTRWN